MSLSSGVLGPTRYELDSPSEEHSQQQHGR
jgi:hypothetical protein